MAEQATNRLITPVITLHAGDGTLPELISATRGAWAGQSQGGQIPKSWQGIRQARIYVRLTTPGALATASDVFLRGYKDPGWDGTFDADGNPVDPTAPAWEWSDTAALLTDSGTGTITLPYDRPLIRWNPEWTRLALVGTIPAAVDVFVRAIVDER